MILVDTLFVCLTLCACLFMCCVYRRCAPLVGILAVESSALQKSPLCTHRRAASRYSRYVAKISREDLQRLTPATCAPTLTGAHDLSAPGLSPIEVHH